MRNRDFIIDFTEEDHEKEVQSLWIYSEFLWENFRNSEECF